ncbi:MAG: RluA family pseudouridine synthase [Kiritimatiellae bacterium]|jgi:tRNA pseudouridine32 synthase/23S rRNA pseudouridine746 synthase|nr:RluA family pseudouridine synthase [Kiritimatiellia bacterium]
MTEIPVVFDDGELLIVNKPSGMLTVPGRSPDLQDCLWARLRDQFPEREVFLVHRLDRDTSGLIVFACNREAQATMGRRFEYRRVHKEYQALVHGRLEPMEGVINAAIRKDWSRIDAPFYIVCNEKGKSAVTRYQVIEQTDESSRVRLFPETGRSHQLRVHMRHLGHPIMGDPIYAPVNSPGPLKLCAVRIRFHHPTRELDVDVSVGVPF